MNFIFVQEGRMDVCIDSFGLSVNGHFDDDYEYKAASIMLHTDSGEKELYRLHVRGNVIKPILEHHDITDVATCVVKSIGEEAAQAAREKEKCVYIDLDIIMGDVLSTLTRQLPR